MDGYGIESRFKDPIRAQVRNVSSGLLVYDQLDHRRQQETVSFRSPLRGYPYLGSIDPYYEGLVQVDSNTIFKSKLATPIVVDGKVISYYSNRDNGHSFLTREGVTFTTCNHGTFYNSNAQWVFGGPVYAAGAIVAPASRYRMPFWVDGSSANQMHRLPYIGSPGDLANYGRKAIERLIPGIPKTSAFVAVGELFVGFPQIIGRTFERLAKDLPEVLLKKPAEEYLNLVFGITPTIKDFNGLVSQLSGATKTILQLERDSGLGVRRKMKFDVPDALAQFNSSELSSQGYLSANMQGYNPNYTGSTQADVGPYYGLQTSLTMRLHRSVSFSGSFTRVIPSYPGLAGSYKRFIEVYTKYVLGSNMTIDRVWELIPFSWLVDWFLNVQRSLSLYAKVQDDSLVINYGYIMGKTVQTVIQDTKLTASLNATSMRSVRSVYLSTRVERIRANPYGFILPDVSLNAEQWAILAALGITRKAVN